MKLTETKLKQIIIEALKESINWKDTLKRDIRTVEAIIEELNKFYRLLDTEEGFCLSYYMQTKSIDPRCDESNVLKMHENVKEMEMEIYDIAEKYGVSYRDSVEVPDILRRKLRRKHPPTSGTGYTT